ncbi:MAG: nucleoside 2-deoxyribosyltransferase [Planctomycetes bacterium]|nr:nucleoside 2-deoxyribosyltransferase [Planctomycetota bacterium]
MPDFENLKTALLCRGEPESVPLFEGSVHEDVKSRFLGRSAGSLEAEVEFHMRAGYDYVPLTIGLRQTMRGEKAGIMGAKRLETTVLKGAEARYNPFQEGTSRRVWAEEGEGIIHDEASYDAYPWPDPDGFDYSPVERLAKLLPDGAKAIVNVGYVFMASWMLMGLERFLVGLAGGEELAAEVVRRVGATQERVVENLLQLDGVGAVRMPDDIAYSTGLIVSPSLLRKHIFPWNKRIGDRVRAKGIPYLYHSDGKLYAVIEDLIDCGFQALHPCEPASMDIERLKREYAGRLCLCGNVDLNSTLTLGTPEEVDREVRERIRTLAPGGGYCCGSSNSVPEYVPYENYAAMIDAVKRYGRYPIRL